PRGTHRTAVDARRDDGGEEPAVEARVAGDEGLPAGLRVEHGVDHCTRRSRDDWPFSDLEGGARLGLRRCGCRGMIPALTGTRARRRLRPPKEWTMARVNPIPEGFTTITP